MVCVYSACRQSCLGGGWRGGGGAWVDNIIRYRNIFKAIIYKIFFKYLPVLMTNNSAVHLWHTAV